MADGSITISTKLDNKELEREFSKLKKEIEKLERSVSDQESKKSPLVQQAEKLEQNMRAARAEVDRYRSAWAAGVAGADKDQADAVLKAQQLEAEHEKVVAQIDKIDAKLQPAYQKLDAMADKAGGIAKDLSNIPTDCKKMGDSVERAQKSINKFKLRLREVVRSALVFTLITQSLAKLREWTGKVIKTNSGATEAMARLKGALLTLAQPLVNVIIPAFTAFVNVLTDIVRVVSGLVSTIFGTTAKESSEAAKNLYNQTDAIEGVGVAAKRTSKQLAAFDEINKLSGGSSSGGGSTSGAIAPDFSEAGDLSWLKERLGEAAGWVTAALMLGGIALIAIGASVGRLTLILSGLVMLGAGVSVGSETGVIESWAETLGLNNVGEFITVALLLAGISLIALGAALGRVSLVIAGIGFLGAGITAGKENGVLASWADSLGLESVFDYVTAAIQLAGIALVAIGACMGNIYMVIAGAGILAVGIAADIIGEDTLADWWDVLKLTSIQQWIGASLLLVGIGLIAIGAAMGNIFMMLAGAAMISLGTIVSAADGNLRDWVTALGLEKVAGWVTSALLLLGIGLIVFGISTGNIMMVLAGAGLLGAGISVGATSGTFQTWIDAIVNGLQNGWSRIQEWWSTTVSPKLKSIKDFFKDEVINPLCDGVENFINFFIDGINNLIGKLNTFGFDLPEILGGGHVGFNIPTLERIRLPRLATGAVIPPNREFLAVLGDQKSGTNIEAPMEMLVQAFKVAAREMVGNGNGNTTIIMELDGQQFAKLVYKANKSESRRVGVSLAGV